MQPSLMQKQVLRAIFVLLAGFVSFPVTTDAAPVKNVEVLVCAVREDIPGSVKNVLKQVFLLLGIMYLSGKKKIFSGKTAGSIIKCWPIL